MSLELMESVLSALPVPMVLVDHRQQIELANDAARQVFGAGLVGRPFVTVFRQPPLIDALERCFRNGETGLARFTVPGSLRDQIFRARTAPLSKAGVEGILISFEDVTEQEQAEAIRRDFVANVSHELRTPLTALLGFIETLKGAARDDAVARDRFLTIMEREALRMNRLVRDLLSLSRVESEERVRPAERADVVALINSTLAALRPMADEAGVQIERTGEPGPVMIPADPDQITQVFQNLIENAVKYGGSGKKVTVAIRRDPRDPGLRGAVVRIDVIDRGEGIEPIHLPRLTERFYRVDSHRSREKGGTGLGLAIVKHIVNRHRGRLKIESEMGRGSQFSVFLPES